MKLWQKHTDSDGVLEAFTVGIDYKLDIHLVFADAMGSIGHGRTLAKAGLLSQDELSRLESGIKKLVDLHARGGFTISQSDEDGHTAMENYLTQELGDVGKKIHTGRSRNDQVLTALRIWEKAAILRLMARVHGAVEVVLQFARQHALVPMPGRTHMQTAMPSTVGLWAGSLAQELLDGATLLQNALTLIDRCPLGSAAGYGVPLPLDREYSAKTLGFAKVFENVIAAQNSRGKLESVVLDACEQVSLTLSKFAQDLIVFTLPELGYFSLPVELTSGSSIMPQKKNPDGLELLRSRAGMVGGWASQIKNIIRSLPTGYNRDFQDTKEPIIRGIQTCTDSVFMMSHTFKHLMVNDQRLRAAHTPDLFATDEALSLVRQGMTFRDAYRQVGTNLEALQAWDAEKALAQRTSIGTPGNPGFEGIESSLRFLVEEHQTREDTLAQAVECCLGPGIDLLGRS